MFEAHDRGFLVDLVEAGKRELNPWYRGPERTLAQMVSLAYAQAFLQQQQPSQDTYEAIEHEFVRRGWDTNIAGAIGQGLFVADAQRSYAPLIHELEVDAEQGSPGALPGGTNHLHGGGFAVVAVQEHGGWIQMHGDRDDGCGQSRGAHPEAPPPPACGRHRVRHLTHAQADDDAEHQRTPDHLNVIETALQQEVRQQGVRTSAS